MATKTSLNREVEYSPLTGLMRSNLAIALISAVFLMLPLLLWRALYQQTDWAAIFLAPLLVILFAGFRKPLADVLQAKAAAAVRPSSRLFLFVTGKFQATILSGVFVAVTVPILAWQALDAKPTMALALMALCIAAASVSQYLPKWLQPHFRRPFATRLGASLGAFAVAVIFVPILAWINWNHITYPGEFRSLEFGEAVRFGIDNQLPARRGWIAEILSLLYAIESAQLWLIGKYGSTLWIASLYCLYLTLVAFVIAKAASTIAFFAQFTISNTATKQNPATNTQPRTAASVPATSNIASVAFWGSIVFLAVATMGIALLDTLSDDVDSNRVIEYEIEPTVLERVLSFASEQALAEVASNVDMQLAYVYDPVYASIPVYADFHYSLRGEYTELAMTVRGWMNNDSRDRISTELEQRLFAGFDERISGAFTQLREQYLAAFNASLEAEIQAASAAGNSATVLGEATQFALNDAVARARVSYPATGAAVLVGGGGLKALTAGMASKLAASVAAKTAAKGAVKGGGALAGAGSGAVLCAWGGPLALACGVGGGIAAWLLADKAIIELDELFNREEFESELRTLIDGDKADKRLRFNELLNSYAQQVDQNTAEIVNNYCDDFSLSELPRTRFVQCEQRTDPAIRTEPVR